ncbi:MAG: polysaccharide pyruvyl transferase family protein [Phocaeicola sp.]|nr:polysaccharide pyruvyl transferase family protein [Phocaeicola sp.]
MKTATITYHASHNYGSMLQAYALQNSLKKMGYENTIINLRTSIQKEFYSCPFSSKSSTLLKKMINLKNSIYRNELIKKYELFESFINEFLITTQEYPSNESLVEAQLDYDCFIAGGDQIWNTYPLDFDWSFFLPFTNRKKISYAVSMGPAGEKEVIDKDKIKNYLKSFSHISVRENGTKKIVESLVDKPISINIDPTLLLSKTEWEKIIPSEPIIKSEYILVYTPIFKKDVYDIAMNLGKILNLNVITTNHIIYHKIKYWKLKYHLDTGPIEFLNILKNARLVICGSYHAVLFSKIFEVPFFAVDGDKDNRMCTFLSQTGLTDRVINLNNVKEKSLISYNCDFSTSNICIEKEREKSINYLKNSIEE